MNEKVKFEVFTAVIMNNTVLCDVRLCGSCKNRHFGGTDRLHHQGDENQRARNNVCSKFLARLFLSLNYGRR
jgi:hypothetical protein